MSDARDSRNVYPSLKAEIVDGRTIMLTLPTEEVIQYLEIPRELHGREIPTYVAEWIAEADEIAVIIQELLAAPTRSLCRLFPVNPNRSPKQSMVVTPTSPIIRPPYGQPGGTTDPPGVTAFDANVAALAMIDGLPEGLQLPVRLLEIIEMGRRLDAWIEKGRRVRDWLDDQGLGDLRWLPEMQA